MTAYTVSLDITLAFSISISVVLHSKSCV